MIWTVSIRTFSSTSFCMLMAVGAATAGLSLSTAIHLPTHLPTLGAAVTSLPNSIQYRGSGRVIPDLALMSLRGQEMAQGHRGSGRITPGLTQAQWVAGHRGSGRAPASILAELAS